MKARAQRYLKGLILKNREFILGQVLAVKGLTELLMKRCNTGQKWTADGIMEMKSHLRMLSKVIPAVGVFLLPGGGLLLPFFVEILDRRKKNARKSEERGRFALEDGTNVLPGSVL